MKISKLFHWLYAFVMFLPIVAVLSAILISTFNMSAKQETEIHYKYETNEINTLEDLQTNKVYHLNTLYIDQDSIQDYQSGSFGIVILKCDYLQLGNIPEIDEVYLVEYDSNINNYLSMYVEYTYIALYTTNSDAYTSLVYDIDANGASLTLNNIDFYIEYGLNEFSNYCFGANYLPTSSTFNTIESVETHNLDTQEVFYNSVDKVREMPIFSWAYNSFLVAPFSYIVALFGMPTNHVVVQLLSYWLAISIIWLVFDLIMYVPLLVHRWLDKGVLE